MTDQDRDQSAPVVDTHAAAPAGQAQPGAADPARPDLPALGGSDELGVDDLMPLAIPNAQRRVRGRPKGAVNLRTNSIFSKAVEAFGDPLIATIAMGNMATDQLIRHLRTIASDCGLKLGCTVMDVVRFQEECRKNALPYGHAKRVAETGAGDPVVPVIGIGTVQGDVHLHSGRSIEDMIDAEKTIEHQPVSEGENE